MSTAIKKVSFMAVVVLAAFAMACGLVTTQAHATMTTTQDGNYTIITKTGSNYEESVQVKLPKGAIALAVYSQSSDYTYASIKDSSGSTVGSTSVYQAATASDDKYIGIPKAGTYTLTISGNNTYSQLAGYYTIPCGGTLTLGKVFLGSSCGNNSTVAYYKVKIKKRGYLKVDFSYTTMNSHYFKLCNSKKKSLTGSWNYVGSDGTEYVGVKKGTYYIAVKSYDDAYGIKAKFTKTVKAVKAKKAKAVNIKKGKVLKAVMVAGEKTAWYKFKVTKSKAYKFALKGKLFGNGVKITFSGKNYYSSSVNLYGDTDSRTFKTTKLKPGTYYIKVTTNSKGNGFYSIKWK